MEIFLVVVAVILLAALVWTRKRKAKKAELANSGLGEQAKPLTVAPKPASKRLDTAARQAESSAADAVVRAIEKISNPTEVEPQPEKATFSISPSSSSDQQEQIPEDSTLRRHYLSTRQAEKEAMSHPYPTDSTLRRHHESMLAMSLKDAAVAVNAEIPALPVSKWCLPEDSALRRHFLTQVRAEIESQLFQRPTDSTLRRHYDSQVEAKMQEYLAMNAA